jgi:hypothetical protein
MSSTMAMKNESDGRAQAGICECHWETIEMGLEETYNVDDNC